MSQKTGDRTSSSEAWLEDTGVALGLIALAALSSPVSQLTLSPVFGSIPASINHNAAITITFIFGFMLHNLLGQRSNTILQSWLPVIAAFIPVAEFFALLASEQLGIVGGAILTGLISCHCIIIPAAYTAATLLQKIGIGRIHDSIPSSFVNASIALVPFIILERLFAAQVLEMISLSNLLTPADLQLIIAAAFVLLCTPGPIAIVVTWTTMIMTYLFNPHGNGPYAQSALQSSLAAQNWTLLTRQWSTTGYVSVLESQERAYRVLRCHHSLLGGEWLVDDARRAQGWTVNEPVYSVFTMLEAVRLVETGTIVPDNGAKALVVGLGVGTAPKAFLQHGIDTTIVELDPVIHQYASQFFNLPTNHTAIIRDATGWLSEQAALEEYKRPHYDYIIHDVFTGGVEPLSLFTASFLAQLRSLLKADGVAAINYAGDLNMPLTVKILNTIDLAFDRQCDVYSDDAARKDGSVEPFSNFVVFCRNSPGEITFRQPTEQDYLGSLNRKSYLVPKAAQRITKTWANSEDVLLFRDIKTWRSAQEISAQKHWAVMRTVLPARVWELY